MLYLLNTQTFLELRSPEGYNGGLSPSGLSDHLTLKSLHTQVILAS